MVKKLSLKKDAVEIKKSEFVESVQKSLKTPIVPIKYCYLAKPFFYPGSHIGRYSVTLLFDKNKQDDVVFLENLQKIALENEVDTLGHVEEEKILIKFQTKEIPKIYSFVLGSKSGKLISLEHDIPEGYNASVEFELNTYFNKTTKKKAFNFCPKRVNFHFDEKTQPIIQEVKENGDNKSRSYRPRTKNNGVWDSKLQSGEKRGLGEQLRNRPNPRKSKGNRSNTVHD